MTSEPTPTENQEPEAPKQPGSMTFYFAGPLIEIVNGRPVELVPRGKPPTQYFSTDVAETKAETLN